MTRILLVYPPFHRLRQIEDIILPLGIASLAAYSENPNREIKLYNVENPTKNECVTSEEDAFEADKVYENNLNSPDHIVWKEVREVIEDFKPHIVGLSVMTCKFGSALKITRIVKSISKDIVTLWGGPHCSAIGKETLQQNECVDYIISHEGEIPFEAFIRSFEKGGIDPEIPNLVYRKNGYVVENAPTAWVPDLNELPFPRKDTDIFQERYSTDSFSNIMASRGCPYQCAFCNSPRVWGNKVRYRTTESILSEIRELKTKFGVKKIRFADDTFTLNLKKTMDFCNALIKDRMNIGWSCTTRFNVLTDELCAAMKKSGVLVVSCGVESGSDRILKAIKKGTSLSQIKEKAKFLEKHNIDWNGYYMVGFPMEQIEDIELTRKAWRELGQSLIILSVFTPYPGTELFDITRNYGLLPENPDWSKFSHQSLNNHFVKDISTDEFAEIVRDMFNEVDSRNNSFLNLMKKTYRRKEYYARNLSTFLPIAAHKIKRKVARFRRLDA